MSLTDIKYDAFISYRHSEKDKFVATTLQKKLETFKLPKSLYSKTNGKTKIERIFRDQDELPLASNLSDPIEEALTNSEYLIVICTPRLPESQWCRKEIETFTRLHGRDHILAILAEGEPDESFPDLLLHENITTINEKGEEITVVRDIEPLAADVRGDSNSRIKKNIDDATLRVAAPIFGLNYDDLKQRHRERRIKKLITIWASIGTAVLIFAIVCSFLLVKISSQKNTIEDQYTEISAKKDEIEAQNQEIKKQNDDILKKNDEITKQNDEITKQNDEIRQKNLEIEDQKNTIKMHYDEASLKYAKIMSYVSNDLIGNGRRNDAIYAVLSALPHNSETADIPYSTDGHLALNNVLDLYNINNAKSPVQTYDCTNSIDTFTVNPSGTTLAIYDTGAVLYVIDADTGKTKYTFDRNQLPTVSDMLFIRDNELSFLSDRNWYVLDASNGNVKMIKEDIGRLYYLDNAGIIGAANNTEIFFFSMADFTCLGKIDLADDTDAIGLAQFEILRATDDGSYIFGILNKGFFDNSNLVVYDGKNLQLLWDTAVSEDILPLIGTDNKSVFLVANKPFNIYNDITFTISRYSLSDGEELWSRSYDEVFSYITDIFYDPGDNLMFLASSTQCYMISPENGQITENLNFKSPYCTILFSEKDSIYFIFSEDGSAGAFIPASNTAVDLTANYYAHLPQNVVKNLISVGGRFFLQFADCDYISMYRADISEETRKLAEKANGTYKTSDNGKYSISYDMDPDIGKYVYSIHNNLDSTKNTTIYDENYNLVFPVTNSDICLTTGKTVNTYESATGTLLSSCEIPAYSKTVDNSISENGRYIAVSYYVNDEPVLEILDLNTKEIICSIPSDEFNITINEATERALLVSDTELAITDFNGNICVRKELPGARINDFRFSSDGRYIMLLMESGDMEFFDAKTLDSVNRYSPSERSLLRIHSFVYSKKNNIYIVISDLNPCYIFDPETMTPTAIFSNCAGYDCENELFVLSNSSGIYTTPYYDYDYTVNKANAILDNYVCSDYIRKTYGIN